MSKSPHQIAVERVMRDAKQRNYTPAGWKTVEGGEVVTFLEAQAFITPNGHVSWRGREPREQAAA